MNGMEFDIGHLIRGAIPIVFIAWIIYRRIRRNFGRQKLRRGWMIFRLVLFSVIALLLLPFVLLSPERALATAAGAGSGVALAIWAAKRTRFQKDGNRLYYIPHTYTGLVVTALFLGRLLYRIFFVSSSMWGAATMGSDPSAGDYGGWSGLASSPLTRALFYAYVSYYLYYYVYVLYESRHLKPADWEQPDAGKPAAGKPPVGGNLPGKPK